MTTTDDAMQHDPAPPAQASRAEGRIVLEARGITRSYGRSEVLAGVDLDLRAGECVVILGRRNSGKSVLARILAGLILPDAGHVDAPEGIAPLVGVATGFAQTGTLERDLALRAAAVGLETSDLVAAATDLLDDPARLDQPFGKLDAMNRATIVFGASYLVPAGVYIADGTPVPIQPGPREVVGPLFEDARERAAVLAFAASVTGLRELAPDRILLLENGRLQPLAGLDEAIARFGPRRPGAGHRPPPEPEPEIDDDE
jgi:energy-coupling factor transporter ATP-binding protein EcfA2